ncbi:MAG: DUF4398 domain-containing protein [Polyangiaceae bacterium]|nr:DUF4398 domain-containing protein [Polyangiaceae bacterium]
MIKHRVRSAARAFAVVVTFVGVVASAAFALGGCGGVIYSAKSVGASSRLEEAKQLGAEELAPYEYYYAREHMTKAQEEASRGDYGDALNLLSVADEYAEKAITLARQARRGAGR